MLPFLNAIGLKGEVTLLMASCSLQRLRAGGWGTAFFLLENSHFCFVQGAVLAKIITDNSVSGKLCLGFPGGSVVRNLPAMQEMQV